MFFINSQNKFRMPRNMYCKTVHVVSRRTAASAGEQSTMGGKQEHTNKLNGWVFGAAKGAAFSGIVLLFIGLQGSEMQATTPTVALSAHVHPHAPQRPAMACMLEFMPSDSRP